MWRLDILLLEVLVSVGSGFVDSMISLSLAVIIAVVGMIILPIPCKPSLIHPELHAEQKTWEYDLSIVICWWMRAAVVECCCRYVVVVVLP